LETHREKFLKKGVWNPILLVTRDNQKNLKKKSLPAFSFNEILDALAR
jgi:hypothetical protein